MDTFKCPKCEKVYDIDDLELWGVYRIQNLTVLNAMLRS